MSNGVTHPAITDVKSMQPEKASRSIEVTLDGIVNDVILQQ